MPARLLTEQERTDLERAAEVLRDSGRFRTSLMVHGVLGGDEDLRRTGGAEWPRKRRERE